MEKLESLLTEYGIGAVPRFGDDVAVERGGAASADRKQGFNTDRFIAEVRAVSSKNRVYFILCFALLVGLFVGAALLVVFSLDDPGRVKSILTVSGVSFLGITAEMLKFVKEKIAIDLTLALTTGLAQKEIKPTLEILLERLKRGSLRVI